MFFTTYYTNNYVIYNSYIVYSFAINLIFIAKNKKKFSNQINSDSTTGSPTITLLRLHHGYESVLCAVTLTDFKSTFNPPKRNY